MTQPRDTTYKMRDIPQVGVLDGERSLNGPKYEQFGVVRDVHREFPTDSAVAIVTC
jgi:hypothetical protein